MDVDEALHSIGDFGRSQIFILMAVGSMSHMLASWIVVGITFLAAFPDHFCTIPIGTRVEDYIPFVETNEEYIFDSCTRYINPGSSDNMTGPCTNGWTFSKTPYGSTIVSEWDLVCDRTQLAALAQSVLILGIMVGSVIFGYISDRIGRKPVLMFSLFCQGCLGIVLAFSPSYWFFLIIRFVMGIIHQGCVTPGLVLVSEFFSPKKRTIGFNLSAGLWPIGVMILAVLAFFIRNWRYLQLAITLPFFVFSLMCWLVPESPRWLVSVGMLQKANTILTKLARFNGSAVEKVELSRKSVRDGGIDNKSFVHNEISETALSNQEKTKKDSSNVIAISEIYQSGLNEGKEDKEAKNATEGKNAKEGKGGNEGNDGKEGKESREGREGKEDKEGTLKNSKVVSSESFTYLYLCKTPRMILITLVLSATWLVSAFCYQGLSLNSVRLAGNPFLNVFLIGAVEIPANIVATTLSVKFGRRKPLCAMLILSGVVCVVTGLIPRYSGSGLDLTPVIVTFAVVGKFFVTASNVTVVLYATEVFPTVVRNKGMAVGVTTARIGPILAPFIVLLDEVHHSLPMLIFGAVSAIPSLFVLLLPETQGTSQPETAEDIDLMYREQKFRVQVTSMSRDHRESP